MNLIYDAAATIRSERMAAAEHHRLIRRTVPGPQRRTSKRNPSNPASATWVSRSKY